MLISSISFENDFKSEDGEYWVDFKSDVMTGKALFFPSKQFQESLTPLSVEVEYREIEDFKVLSSGVEHEYRVEALADRGNYQVIGQVSSIVLNRPLA
jgi:hypothetical protein